jgi:hypothetical protein
MQFKLATQPLGTVLVGLNWLVYTLDVVECCLFAQSLDSQRLVHKRR